MSNFDEMQDNNQGQDFNHEDLENNLVQEGQVNFEGEQDQNQIQPEENYNQQIESPQAPGSDHSFHIDKKFDDFTKGESFGQKERTLNQLSDREVLDYCLERINPYADGGRLYKKRYNSTIAKAIKTVPTVKMFESVFQAMVIKQWESFRRANINGFENLFGKISSELRNNDDFSIAFKKLDFMVDIEVYLEDSFRDLRDAMIEYFDIYHSDVEDKLEKMRPSQDKINYFVSLYLSKRKDNYIKIQLKLYSYWLRQFFTLRLDNPTVDKKLKQTKKKNEFIRLFLNHDVDVCSFIDNIKQKYSQELNKELIDKLVLEFIVYGKTNILDIVSIPDNYDAYERYERAVKLIRRLNLGYISFEGPEVKSYQDIIGYSSSQKQYVYIGASFSKEDQDKYVAYKKLSKVFNEIKREIMMKIINMTVEITEEEKDALVKEMPFNDEYFEFNKEFLSVFSLGALYNSFLHPANGQGFNPTGFEDKDSYNLINEIIVNNGIMWLLLFLNNSGNSVIAGNGIRGRELNGLINEAYNMTRMAKRLNLKPNNFSQILLLADISDSADLESIEILGLDMIGDLCRNLDFTNHNKYMIITRARRLIAMMAKRKMSTVPYVSGETMNYKYSLYDSQDDDVLLAGIKTDACFRICAIDNDFLHYCCLDKNGFVIRITDKEGNFIGRAGGFRNGNCVFLNQLRTIYDESGNNYHGKFENEREEVIETFRKACEDIVRTSQENELESEKIDYVFVTRSYSLNNSLLNMYQTLKRKIGDYPMEMNSQDWKDFVDDNSGNLRESSYNQGFSIDYCNYSLICMASTKSPNEIVEDDLRFGDRPAVYERTRNKIIATTNIDSKVLRKIKKIHGIDLHFNRRRYEEVIVPEGATVFVGDNWYLIYSKGEIVSSCVLDFDEKALREFNLTSETIKKGTNEFIKSKDLEATNEVSENVLKKVPEVPDRMERV